MSLLFETIKLYNGKLFNLPLHNERLNRSRKELFGCRNFVDLEKELVLPENINSGLYKCRVVYEKEIDKIEWEQYIPKEIKKLKLVYNNEINYTYKFLNRDVFDQLKTKAGSSYNEEILIIKNGFVTDTSYTNVVLFNGEDWITPHKPLLNGTQRKKLIDENIIKEKPVRVEDLIKYESIKMINAMLDFEYTPALPIQSVV